MIRGLIVVRAFFLRDLTTSSASDDVFPFLFHREPSLGIGWKVDFFFFLLFTMFQLVGC